MQFAIFTIRSKVDVDSIPELGYFQDFQRKKKGADNIRPITVIWTIYY